MKEKRLGKAIIYHIVVFIIGVIMIYPLLWMVMSSFKETGTIFTTAGSLIPETFTLGEITQMDGRDLQKFHFLPFLRALCSFLFWLRWEQLCLLRL